MRFWQQLFWAVVIGASAILLSGLGVWQLNRLGERRALNAVIIARLAQPPVEVTGGQTDPVPIEYLPVTAAGEYDFSREVVIRNRAYQGLPGVHLLTPLLLHGCNCAVVVDRGWIEYTAANPARRAAYAFPAGTLTVNGLMRLSQSRPSAFAPADPTPSAELPTLDAWHWVDIGRLQQQMPYRLLPFYIELEANDDPTALPVAGSDIDLTEGAHLSYAIQWFSFATILVAGSIALSRQRKDRR